MAILEDVIKIIKETLNKKDLVVTAESNLEDDLGADSIDAMQIIMELEDKYEIEIPTESAENIKTVKDLVKYIEDLQK